jgi:hypothetical protein
MPVLPITVCVVPVVFGSPAPAVQQGMQHRQGTCVIIYGSHSAQLPPASILTYSRTVVLHDPRTVQTRPHAISSKLDNDISPSLLYYSTFKKKENRNIPVGCAQFLFQEEIVLITMGNSARRTYKRRPYSSYPLGSTAHMFMHGHAHRTSHERSK